MSLGYEGVCKLVEQDEEMAIYVYSGANINDNYELRKQHALNYDGEFLIYKRCLEEPEIHTKIKRSPSGRKYEEVKRITHFSSVAKHIENGDVVIEKECFNAFRRYANAEIDYIAYRLIEKIFTYYQENGCLPEKEGFIQ